MPLEQRLPPRYSADWRIPLPSLTVPLPHCHHTAPEARKITRGWVPKGLPFCSPSKRSREHESVRCPPVVRRGAYLATTRTSGRSGGGPRTSWPCLQALYAPGKRESIGPLKPTADRTVHCLSVPLQNPASLRSVPWACSRPVAVERQQLAENLVVGDCRRPTVRGSHSRVKSLVRIGEPLRPGVVEVGQHALLERLRRILVAVNRPLRIAGRRLVDPFDPFRRVEPPVA